MYHSPFRIRHRPAGQPEPDYGPTLTPQIALGDHGPLHEQGPGDLTKWMGLPWQADTGFCRSGYDTNYDPYVPTFWPARVPNQVLTEPNYRVVINTAAPREERLAAFASRMTWTAPLLGSRGGQMEQMVHIFGDMGLVEVREGVQGDPDFPPTMMVASFGPGIQPPPPPQPAGPRDRGTGADDGGPSDRSERPAPPPGGPAVRLAFRVRPRAGSSAGPQAKRQMSRDFSVIVAGGGPAGSAAAIVLAKSGRRVLLVDDSAPRAFRIGEALPPAAVPLLRDLGVLDRFLADKHLPCFGNVSSWGSEELAATDFLFNPHGHGWHLDRARFDAMLRSVAEESGAALMSGARVTGAIASGRRDLDRVADPRDRSSRATSL